MIANSNQIGTGKTAAAGRKNEAGYVLLVFVMFSALLVVGLSKIIPQVAFEGQREKEEELLFRGQQYQRAIQLFFRKFGRYPNSLEELEETSGIRFLRKAYLDPITKENDWRLIHIGPGGGFPDAKNPPTPPANLGDLPASQPGGTGLEASPGLVPSPGMFGSTGQSPTGGMPSTAQAAAGGQQQQGFQAIGQAVMGQLQSSAPALNPSANPGSNPQLQPRASGQVQGTEEEAASGTRQASGAQVFGGGGIAGVASQSTEGSIKVFNGYRQHDDWEFIYNFSWDPLGVAALAKITGAPQQQLQTPATSTRPSAPRVPQWLGTPPRDARRPAAPVPDFLRSPIPGTPPVRQQR